jgi:dihydroorotate dehydrogenase
VPLAVKIAPDLDASQIEMLARVFSEMQLDAVIATNTTISRTGVELHPMKSEHGGLSGAPLTQRSTEVIAAFHQFLPSSIPIIGVGGIMNAADAQAKLKAGAKLAQVYTGLVYRGPNLISEIADLTVG